MLGCLFGHDWEYLRFGNRECRRCKKKQMSGTIYGTDLIIWANGEFKPGSIKNPERPVIPADKEIKEI